MDVAVLILNYNGRRLLEANLPSVISAAEKAGCPCLVGVVDNDSTDDSCRWLAGEYPDVRVWRQPNRGLCSFNEVLAQIGSPIVLLLNNDIELEGDFVRRLIEPLDVDSPNYDPRCFMAAPLCWLTDHDTCEGFKTAVRWRWGLVQATGRFPGHQRQMFVPGLTASAGAAIAVDRRRFLELGGFDPLFLPGRIEDLDFAYRGFQAGHVARYIPSAVCYHAGMATFGAVYGPQGCDALALRNTILFQWKNLRHPLHRGMQLAGLAVRLAVELVAMPFAPRAARLKTWRAMKAAWSRRQALRAGPQPHFDRDREREFFRRFHPSTMVVADAKPPRQRQAPNTANHELALVEQK